MADINTVSAPLPSVETLLQTDAAIKAATALQVAAAAKAEEAAVKRAKALGGAAEKGAASLLTLVFWYVGEVSQSALTVGQGDAVYGGYVAGFNAAVTARAERDGAAHGGKVMEASASALSQFRGFADPAVIAQGFGEMTVKGEDGSDLTVNRWSPKLYNRVAVIRDRMIVDKRHNGASTYVNYTRVNNLIKARAKELPEGVDPATLMISDDEIESCMATSQKGELEKLEKLVASVKGALKFGNVHGDRAAKVQSAVTFLESVVADLKSEDDTAKLSSAIAAVAKFAA